jgi:hypothetical protein
MLASNSYRSPSSRLLRMPPIQALLSLSLESDITAIGNSLSSSAVEEVRARLYPDGIKNSDHSMIINAITLLDSCYACLKGGKEVCSLSKQMLQPYYEIAKKAIRQSKCSLLKHKLTERRIDIGLEPLAVAFQRIEQIFGEIFIAFEKIDFSLDSSSVGRTVAAMPLFAHPIVGIEAFKLVHHFATNRLNHLCSPNLEGLEVGFATFKYQLECARAEVAFQERRAQHITKDFLTITPDCGNLQWSKLLEHALLRLVDEEDLVAVAAILVPIQVLEMIAISLGNKAIATKLPYIMTSLNYDVLEEVLFSLSENRLDLQAINQLFREIVRERPITGEWIEKQFFALRQAFIDTRNHGNEAIDMLTKRFRKHLYAHRITLEDLRDIDELRESIKIHSINVTAIKELYKEIVHDPETIQDFNELQVSYEEDIARLTAGTTVNNVQIKGHIFDIIERNAFAAEGYEDDDNAFECFAMWSLASAKALWEHHLLGNMSNEEFQTVSGDLTLLSKIALKNLNDAGIVSIADCKRLRIYNGLLLKEFMGRQNGRASG